MTTRVKVEYMAGNQPVEVIDLRDGSVAGTLNNAGDVFEQNLHSGAELKLRELTGFRESSAVQGGDNGSDVPDERVED